MTPASDEIRDHRIRLVFRCVLEFLLDECRALILTHGGNVTRAAVRLAVAQASQRRSEGAISVRAIAQSLALPYETTRRQVAALEVAGLLARSGEIGGRGVTAHSPSPGRQAQARLRALHTVVADLKGLSFIFDPVPHGAAIDDDALARQLSELVDDFILRVLEAGVDPHGSILDAVVFSALVSANAGPITYDLDLALAYAGSDSPPPDTIRRPATITQLAERLGLPHETVRRRIAHHRSLGWAVRVRGGYLSAMSRQESPEVMQSSQIIVQRFLQLIRAAGRLGLDLEAISPTAHGPPAGARPWGLTA